MNNIYYGLTTLLPTVNVLLSDIDGADIVTEFMNEVVYFREHPEEHYKPINVYINTGVLGDLMTERVVIYVYAGIPFILSTAERITGSDEYDAKIDDLGGSFITRMATKDCRNAYSLGFVSKNVSVEKYAMRYMKANSLLTDHNIDATSVGISISNGVLKSHGSLFKPGRYLYDIYVADTAMSKMIRSYKDFTANPVDEMNVPTNTKEILLYGGYPEIVNLGMLSTEFGYVYDVWIPNDYEYYFMAKDLFDQRIFPTDIFTTDQEDLIESYSILCKEVHELDKANDEEEGESDDDDDEELPDIPELP